MLSPRQPAEFELLDIDADHVKGAGFNLLVAVWRFHTHYEPFRRCLHWIDMLASRHPRGIGVMHVVEPSAIPPAVATRRLFADIIRQPGIEHYSVIHTARGFKAASIRAIVAASVTLARPRFPHTVHADVQQAAAWCAAQQRRIGRGETSDQIAHLVESLRALHRERYAGGRQAP